MMNKLASLSCRSATSASKERKKAGPVRKWSGGNPIHNILNAFSKPLVLNMIFFLHGSGKSFVKPY